MTADSGRHRRMVIGGSPDAFLSFISDDALITRVERIRGRDRKTFRVRRGEVVVGEVVRLGRREWKAVRFDGNVITVMLPETGRGWSSRGHAVGAVLVGARVGK